MAPIGLDRRSELPGAVTAAGRSKTRHWLSGQTGLEPWHDLRSEPLKLLPVLVPRHPLGPVKHDLLDLASSLLTLTARAAQVGGGGSGTGDILGSAVLVEVVHPGGVAPYDLSLLFLGDPLQDLLDDLP